MSSARRIGWRGVVVGMGAEVGVSGRATTRRFLAALYRSAPVGSLVEVRFSVASGMARRFHRVAELEGVVDAVAGLARWTDAFVGVVPRRRKPAGVFPGSLAPFRVPLGGIFLFPPGGFHFPPWGNALPIEGRFSSDLLEGRTQ